MRPILAQSWSYECIQSKPISWSIFEWNCKYSRGAAIKKQIFESWKFHCDNICEVKKINSKLWSLCNKQEFIASCFRNGKIVNSNQIIELIRAGGSMEFLHLWLGCRCMNFIYCYCWIPNTKLKTKFLFICKYSQSTETNAQGVNIYSPLRIYIKRRVRNPLESKSNIKSYKKWNLFNFISSSEI